MHSLSVYITNIFPYKKYHSNITLVPFSWENLAFLIEDEATRGLVDLTKQPAVLSAKCLTLVIGLG